MLVPTGKKKRAQRQPAYAIIILYLAKISILIFCGYGGIGIRVSLKIWWFIRVGSSPTIHTIGGLHLVNHQRIKN